MVQRDTGRLSQSTVDGLQPQRDIATARSMGSNPQGNMRSFPGNVISPRELTNVPAEAVVVGEQYLVFSLLECELALKAEHIDGVERLADVTPVPNADLLPQWLICAHFSVWNVCLLIRVHGYYQ